MGQQCCCEKDTNGPAAGIVKVAKSYPHDPQVEETLRETTGSVLTLHVQSSAKIDTIALPSTSTTKELRQILQASGFIQTFGAQLVLDGTDLPDDEALLSEAGFEEGSTVVCKEEPMIERLAAIDDQPETLTTAPAIPAPPPGDGKAQGLPGASSELAKPAKDAAVEHRGRTFSVEVSRDPSNPQGSKLGLVVFARDNEDFLRIRAISTGLITDWNATSSVGKVSKSTAILSVNGIKDQRQCAEELRNASNLRMEMMELPPKQ
mmetsp:Transcript_12127/g.28321  ORF Transcript_12127/g.28321 Transcript_12127/m.28321 type:complete len:263 (-) Transcript_12127:193-981(-)